MAEHDVSPTLTEIDLEVLGEVERRVLWLATSIIQHANSARPNSSGVKVGGHQASSASITTIMTALWFAGLSAEDRVSVKPHASPVLHAINYLLGDLDQRYLTELRAYGGLQSYPSRTKDPDTVDYSTGSVGIGATAPIWGALAKRYADAHATQPTDARRGRQISLLGDAELDEGACWEAILDPTVAGLGEVCWIVDLNRQSLDRIIPAITADRLEAMFDAAGWQVMTLKYGHQLEELYGRPGGHHLRARIDAMPNQEYQRLLRSPDGELRERLVGQGDGADAIASITDQLDDAALRSAVRDLGGHDLATLIEAFACIDDDRPTAIIAYTVKGHDLPTEGHPQNHSALLTAEQYDDLAPTLGADADDPWARFADDSAAAALCRLTAERLHREKVPATVDVEVPGDLGRQHGGTVSTQAALGRVLLDLQRAAPDAAARVVTVSPDVASSTNLGGWINKVGVFAVEQRRDWFADDAETLLHWREHPQGQHLELGIAEVNLVGLLGELGATWSRWGERLFPVGTLYDPFVNRALEPWTYGVYAGGQSILVGTPSGVSLAPEGGAHQSIITPSIGLEVPGVVAYEPAFAQDLEWCFLDALTRLGRADGCSAYLRLSTRPLDQTLAAVPPDGEARETRRRDVLAGGYVLHEDRNADVTVAVAGVLVPEAVAAVAELARMDVAVRVVVVTSADLLFRAVQARRGLRTGTGAPIDESILDRLLPDATPLVTVLDGHPHTLSFLGNVRQAPVACLGVTEYGQVGSLDEMYRLHQIDTRAIAGAALDLLD